MLNSHIIIIPEECVTLFSGSSIIARVKTETFPNDAVVHAYRGSSTEEKIKVLDQYIEEKFKCVIKQDGTNSILKKNYQRLMNLALNIKNLSLY